MISPDVWIDVHQSAGYRQVKLEALEATVRAYDSAVIHCDVIDSECVYQGQTITGRFRVTHVWVTDHLRWQLAGVQSPGCPVTSVAVARPNPPYGVPAQPAECAS